MKKRMFLVVAMLLLIAVSCAFAENAKPYAGVTLNVLGNSSTPSTFMQEHLAEFEEETGIKVNYEQLTNDQLNTKILVSMAAGGADLDVFMYMAYQNTQKKWQMVPARTKICHTMCEYGSDFQR